MKFHYLIFNFFKCDAWFDEKEREEDNKGKVNCIREIFVKKLLFEVNCSEENVKFLGFFDIFKLLKKVMKLDKFFECLLRGKKSGSHFEILFG